MSHSSLYLFRVVLRQLLPVLLLLLLLHSLRYRHQDHESHGTQNMWFDQLQEVGWLDVQEFELGLLRFGPCLRLGLCPSRVAVGRQN